MGTDELVGLASDKVCYVAVKNTKIKVEFNVFFLNTQTLITYLIFAEVGITASSHHFKGLLIIQHLFSGFHHSTLWACKSSLYHD